MKDKVAKCGSIALMSSTENQEIKDIMVWQDQLIAKVRGKTGCQVSYEALTIIIQEFGNFVERKKRNA